MRRRWRILFGAIVLGAAAALGLTYEPPREKVSIPPSPRLLITGVTVVDPRNGHLSPGMAVLMEKGRIVGMMPAGSVSAAAAAQVVDAAGKFLVPGFNDMHAHPLGASDPSGTLALMLAYGVTGFRQMSGDIAMLEQRRDGTLPTGRYSPAALIMPGPILTPLNAATPEQAIAVVRENKAQGADFIKVGVTTPAAFYAAEAEARRLGLPFAGHLQQGVDAAEASRRGMRAIEHLGPQDTLLTSCSTAETVLRAQAAKDPPVKGPPIKLPFMEKLFAKKLRQRIINPLVDADPVIPARIRRIENTLSEDKCRRLAAIFVRHRTWQIPTLIRLKTSIFGDDPRLASDPNLAFMPPEVSASWREAAQRYRELDPEVRAIYRRNYANLLKVTKLFDQAGVKMLAGSDESGGWEVPGLSLHQEFDELGRAGLSPLRILQMTTSNAAEFLNRTGSMGTIERGKAADMVLLDANPVESVANLHRIAGVVRAGYYHSRPDLERLKARVAAGKGYLK